MRYIFAADSFYIMQLCSRLFVLHCRSRPRYDISMHFDPHFEEVKGGVEPWWMGHWKTLAEFSLSVIELLFTARAMYCKRCISDGNSVCLSVRLSVCLSVRSRLFVLCRSRPKDDKSRHFDPHFEEVRGGV